DARTMRPRLRGMCRRVRAARARALQAVRDHVPRMRRRLPSGGGIALEVGLAEALDALIVAGRIEHADVELDRVADPMRERRMVGEIVIGQRMDERPQA